MIKKLLLLFIGVTSIFSVSGQCANIYDQTLQVAAPNLVTTGNSFSFTSVPTLTAGDATVTITVFGDVDGTGTNTEEWTVFDENANIVGAAGASGIFADQCNNAVSSSYTIPQATLDTWVADGTVSFTADDLTGLINLALCTGDYVEINLSYDFIGSGVDSESPVADIATLNDFIADCSVSSLTPPTATDNCSGVINGTTTTTFPITTQGTTVVTWIYDDGNGNTSSQTQVVGIADLQAPVADVVALADVIAECEVTALTDPTATDNCAGLVTVTNDAILPISSQGTTVVTWTYDDGNGNTSSQAQNVIINDITPPNPDIPLLTDFSETCEATIVTNPTATDNCGVVITGVPDVTFPISTFGTTIVTWTYTDALGNASSQTQNVIVNAVDSTVTPSGTTLTANQAGATYQWLDCDNGSAVIAGETNQSFSLASGSGNFAVEVSLNGCTDTSACYNLDYSNIVYSFDPFDGDMDLVDTTNFTFSQIALTSPLGTVNGVNGADTDPCGTVYVVFKPGSDRYLGTVDLASGVITETGMLSDKVANIAFSKEGVLYGVTGDGASSPETLFTIDVASAAMTLVTALGNGNDGESIEFCPENNKLYHWSGYGNPSLIMEEIDLTTLNVTPISFSGSGASLINNVGSSTYAGNGRFLCGEVYDNELWWIDTAGVVTAAASSYGESSKGLVFEAVSSAMVENLNPGLDSICPNDTLTLVCNSDVVSATYLWYLDGISTGITNPTLEATIGGSYNCVVSLACGDINSDTIEITQLNAPNVSISPSPTVDLCAGDSVMLSGASGGTLQWYLDGSPISGASSSSYYATASGDYNMIKTNSNGCSDSASLATSVVTITVDAGATQIGTSLTADANGLTYQWLDCDNGYTAIAGETNQSFSPTAVVGNYAVEVTNNGCADTSACFNVDFTGVTDLNVLGLSIYPNPSTNYFFVESVKSSLESIEILDNSGRIVYSNYQITDTKTQVDVTKLSRGLYLINLSGEFGRITKEIIIH